MRLLVTQISMKFNKILIIQTAFIGDVILATPLIKKLHQYFPQAEIDFLVRKGNEGLLKGHPLLNELLIWDKKKNKYNTLLKLISRIRKNRYDLLINVQRFATTGILTALSNANYKVGFDKNPLSFLYHKKFPHPIDHATHEVERNLSLISEFTDKELIRPELFPSQDDFKTVAPYKHVPYICIAPASVWFTKQYPAEKWIDLIKSLAFEGQILLLGAPSDLESCENIKKRSKRSNVINLAGKLSLLQSAALMKDAILNYVNDSAPLHLASAVNAHTCAVFCSTVPSFGFYPLADFSKIVEIKEPLSCRPCGLHGYRSCPLGHFNCAHHIENSQLMEVFHQAMEHQPSK